MIFVFLTGWAFLVLAAARISKALVYETIFKGLRATLAARSAKPVWRFLRDMLECHWCTSFWVAGIMLIAPAVAAIAVTGFWWQTLLAYPYIWAAGAYATGYILDREG